ncbi:DUF2750 domain-containing protein [Rhodanobacter aciditrophus]|uniref:DUF2750 domain-containing protein n=1 Tax=Rhodanobacter aciditrophus TaxID=1623218 RepID=A0ABW4B1G7_9GAMM
MSSLNTEFFRQTSQVRFELFVNHIKREQACFVLADPEGCLILEVAQEQVLPIWPTAEMANEWASKEHEGFSAMEISAADLTEKWLPGMTNDGFSVGVAPNMAGEGIVLQAAELLNDLQR